MKNSRATVVGCWIIRLLESAGHKWLCRPTCPASAMEISMRWLIRTDGTNSLFSLVRPNLPPSACACRYGISGPSRPVFSRLALSCSLLYAAMLLSLFLDDQRHLMLLTRPRDEIISPVRSSLSATRSHRLSLSTAGEQKRPFTVVGLQYFYLKRTPVWE